MASDLTSFASHAGRSTVTVDDVLLLARRNDDLADMLRAYLEKLRADKEADEGRNAGRAGAMSRVGGSGTAAGRGRGTGRA